jgi:hypothetical protein
VCQFEGVKVRNLSEKQKAKNENLHCVVKTAWLLRAHLLFLEFLVTFAGSNYLNENQQEKTLPVSEVRHELWRYIGCVLGV